jgi:hypothetical protein
LPTGLSSGFGSGFKNIKYNGIMGPVLIWFFEKNNNNSGSRLFFLQKKIKK